MSRAAQFARWAVSLFAGTTGSGFAYLILSGFVSSLTEDNLFTVDLFGYILVYAISITAGFALGALTYWQFPHIMDTAKVDKINEDSQSDDVDDLPLNGESHYLGQ
jgi:hypothetical protein